ncbi:S-layer domain-containing protein [Halalkaliarchaeum desulfuricum]|uniref:S-layer domain-containing protein n=1 Tax=Halalkaliarchaeum desulfuricum TaxID=2055893 RepID=A0A343TMZ8_9EURY|nr:hypothetical protein [Halalkaliarchaeum desulfuricum]AUX10470.1 S-layer domain-containing protein [Halalkaliarchaeum desulfuricum]
MIARRWLAVGISVVAILALLSVPVAGEIFTRGEPDIDVYLPENEVSPGEVTTLELQLQNDGDLSAGTQREAVTTARSVTVEVRDSGPFELRTGTTPVGTIQDGMTVPAPVGITVPEDLEPGEYEIDVRVRYSYTQQIQADANFAQDRTARDTHTLTVKVLPDSQFEIVSVTGDVQPGSGGDATVEIRNVGSETAQQARATIVGGGGLVFDDGTAETFLGDLEPNESTTVDVDASLAPDATQSPKPVSATIQYRDGDGRDLEAPARNGSLAPIAAQEFDVRDLDSALSVGYGGEITATVVNEGPRTVSGATVALEADSPAVTLEEPRAPIGTLDPGESTTVRFDAGVASDIDPGLREVSFVVEYDDEAQDDLRSDRMKRVVAIEDRQFEVVDLADTLSVGYDGEITGTLVNDGPVPIEDGVLTIEPATESLFVEERRFALPHLEPGESAAFAFPTDVSGQADAGPRQVSFTVEYRSATDKRVQSETITRRVMVEPKRPEFALSSPDARVDAGGETTLEIEITNERPETLSNIDARLYAESPFDSTSDEAFVSTLESGESATLQFHLSADQGTMAKTYPVELDFQYDTERGDTVLSDTYQYPVEVIEPEDGDDGWETLLLVIGAVLVIAGIVGGVLLFRRR